MDAANQISDRLISVTDDGLLILFCPGCLSYHGIPTKRFPGERSKIGRAVWKWNGDLFFPTVSPSFSIEPAKEWLGCEFKLTAGVMKFGSRCEHNFARERVALWPIERCR